MRLNFVVVTPVVLDDDLRIDSVPEPLHAQAFGLSFITRLLDVVLTRAASHLAS